MQPAAGITSTSYGDAVSVVSLVGELDMAESDALRATFLGAITSTRPNLVIDLSRTTFLDSIALGTIVGARRKAKQLGGWVRLVAPSPAVAKVFRVTGLDTVFTVHATTAAAVRDGLDAPQGPLRSPADC